MHRAIKSRRSINTPFTPEIENSVYISGGQTGIFDTKQRLGKARSISIARDS